MKKITALALTSAMVLSLAACGGSSSDTKTSDDSKKASKSDVEYVQDKGTLVVGITDFEPMDYKNDKDEWIGFDADMAKAFAKSLGVEVWMLNLLRSTGTIKSWSWMEKPSTAYGMV